MRAADHGLRRSCNLFGNGRGGCCGEQCRHLRVPKQVMELRAVSVRLRYQRQQPADFLWQLARRPWSAGGGRAAWAGRAARGRGAGGDAGEALPVSRSRVRISAISSISAISAEESRSPASMASVSPLMKLANVSTGVGSGGLGIASC